jgi:hypothetical protein
MSYLRNVLFYISLVLLPRRLIMMVVQSYSTTHDRHSQEGTVFPLVMSFSPCPSCESGQDQTCGACGEARKSHEHLSIAYCAANRDPKRQGGKLGGINGGIKAQGSHFQVH